jgi:TonB family protein
MNAKAFSKRAAGCAVFLLIAGGAGFSATGGGAAETDGGGGRELRVTHLVEPVFPATLPARGILRGEVVVVFSVDPAGRLDDWLVLADTHEALARETVRALKAWQFEPVLAGGAPVWSRAQLRVTFEAPGAVVTKTVIDSFDMLTGDRLKYPATVRVFGSLRELDRPPALKRDGAPLYPAELAGAGAGGSALVEFFIDEKGRVRMPVIESADHGLLGVAAVDAVLRWKFEPPVRNGKPAVVRVRQRFDFNPGA